MGAEEALGGRGESTLSLTADAVGLGHRKAEIRRTFERLASSWARRAASERAPSFHTADGSPLEVSAPLGSAEPEVRFTVEPQAAPFGHTANWRASVDALRSLQGLEGVSLAPVEPFLAALEPPGDEGFGFAMWLGAVFRGDRPVAFKTYFNASFAAMRGHPWPELLVPAVGAKVLERVQSAVAGHPVADVGIISFDLLEGAQSRVKLYLGHAIPGPRMAPVDLACIERLEKLGQGSTPGDARRLLETFAPEILDPSSDVPAFVGSTLHVLSGEIERVTTNVQFLPFGPGEPPPEQDLRGRAEATLAAFDVPGAADMKRFLGAVSSGLEPSARCLTYLSVQRERGRPRFTVYASPCLYEERRPVATA